MSKLYTVTLRFCHIHLRYLHATSGVKGHHAAESVVLELLSRLVSLAKLANFS